MRPLEGVKVVEMATFVAIPSTGVFLANMGAEVIKVEPRGGDGIRWAAASEWRSTSPYENTTFDMLNANKKSIVLNLKAPEGKEALMKLLDDCDIFITNWRVQALKKLGLDYDSLHAKYPKMVFASVSGFGEKGPDKDLPGYDFTAFWGRGGILADLPEKSGRPLNIAAGFGDLVAGMGIGEGVLAAYIKAMKTGVGEKVEGSLVHTSAYLQQIMLVASQFENIGKQWPLSYKEINNPLNGTYKTADGRWIQTSCPPFNMLRPAYMKCIGRPDLADDPRYTMENIAANNLYGEFIDILVDAYSKVQSADVIKAFTEADIPFALCYTWKEVLNDPQNEANDVFYNMKYPTGLEIKLLRHPVFVGDELPEYKIAPYLGADTEAVLKGLGYGEDQLKALHEAGIYNTWEDLKGEHGG